MTEKSTIVSLSNISLTRQGKKILSNISWHIRRGQHWALIGANGSGKTMLLKIISGYQWPSSGQVKVLGKSFGKTDLRELRKEIGWVSSDLRQRMQQNFTAKEVVLSGLFASIGLYVKTSKTDKSYANDLMEFMGVRELAERCFPLLSFGEQTRVLIARALITDPKLLLLDEPCVGLDLKAREEFLPFLQKLGEKKNGPTVIFTTHHIEEIMPFISHVLALKDGRVCQKGSKDDVLLPETIKSVFGVEVSLAKKNGRYWVYMGNSSKQPLKILK